MSFNPPKRPQNSPDWFITKLNETRRKFGHPDWDGKSAEILVCEGYYRLMGDPTKNDRRINDDAIVLITPNVVMAVNGNADPSGTRAGHGEGVAKGMGNPHYGVHKDVWAVGQHKSIKPALVQVGQMIVRRDADKTVTKDKTFLVEGMPYYIEYSTGDGFNFHPGGLASTSSIGCTTVYPPQWKMIITAIVEEMKNLNQKRISLVKDSIRG